MSRSYETFRDGDSIDWNARSITDAQWQDALDSDPQTEPRFYTPRSFVPVIPPVLKSNNYNAFDSFTDQDWEDWQGKEYK